MKKLLIVMAFAGLISACNDSGKSDDGQKKDTSNASLNAPATLTADRSKMAVDSTIKPDTAKGKVDSAAKK